MSRGLFIGFTIIVLLGFVLGLAALQGTVQELLAPSVPSSVREGASSSTSSDPLITKAPVISQAQRVPPVLGSDPVRGDASAPLTMIEFGDYQCPSCQTVEATVKKLLQAHSGKVKLIWKDFSLFFHTQGREAAKAAHCAGVQGKFWEYHDVLLSEEDRVLLPGALANYAKSVNLDLARFQSCLDGGAMSSIVDASLELGSDYGVDGVPYFFIGGTKIPFAASEDEFTRVIEEELAKLDSAQ